MKRQLFLTIAFATLMITNVAGAQVSIHSQTSKPAPKIIVRTPFDFEKDISLRLKLDPSLLPSDVLIKKVSALGMVDAHGVKITSGFDIDMNSGHVVAFSGGTSEIINSSVTPSGIMITASFKDKGGNFVSPPAGSLAVYSLSGQRLCFEYKDVVTAAPKMAFALLLDRSGSMGNVIEKVQQKANAFLKDLPRQAECAVASFNENYAYHNQYYQSCNGGDFKLDSLQAGGGTDLYAPLLNAYNSLSQPYFKDYQKAVIIITDGQITPDALLQAKISAAKQNILTFVYFLGEREDRYLQGIADAYLSSNADLSTDLEQYFKSLSTAYRTQKVLQVRPCQGGQNAQP